MNHQCRLLEVTEEDIRASREPYGITEETVEEAVRIVQEWSMTQPHMPKHLDIERTRRIIVISKGNVERTKRLTAMYYRCRSTIPELFLDRDPKDALFRTAMNTIAYIPLRRTYNNDRICIVKLMDADPDNFHPWEMLKLGFMIGDIRLLTDSCSRDVYVFDMQDVTMKHATKFSLRIIKSAIVTGLQGYGFRINALHFVNANGFLDMSIRMIKKLFPEKIAGRIYAHKDFTTVYKHLPREYLPMDYGGLEKSTKEMQSDWNSELDRWRNWFLSDNEIKQ